MTQTPPVYLIVVSKITMLKSELIAGCCHLAKTSAHSINLRALILCRPRRFINHLVSYLLKFIFLSSYVDFGPIWSHTIVDLL